MKSRAGGHLEQPGRGIRTFGTCAHIEHKVDHSTHSPVGIGVCISIGVGVGVGVGVSIGVCISVGISVGIGIAIGISVGISIGIGINIVAEVHLVPPSCVHRLPICPLRVNVWVFEPYICTC
jgi:hypothetical protein